jgi:hypothetical protein
MPRKPSRHATPPEDSPAAPENPGDFPTTVVFNGPDGLHTFTITRTPPNDNPPPTPAEPLVLTAEMRQMMWDRQVEFAAAERERLNHWTSSLTDPKRLTLRQLKELQKDIEDCCKILGFDPDRPLGPCDQSPTGRLLIRLHLIREQAHGYVGFLRAVDEVLKVRFSAAAIEQAILLLGQRPGLTPRKAEALSLTEAAELLSEDSSVGASNSADVPRTLADLAAIVRREKPRQSAVARLLDLLHKESQVSFDQLQEKVHLCRVDDDAIERQIKSAKRWISEYKMPFELVVSDRYLSRRSS